MPYVSNTRVAELNFLSEAFHSGRCTEPLLSSDLRFKLLFFSSLSRCVLIALSRCKFHEIEFFNAFFNLPRACRFDTRPNPPSKNPRNAGGAQYLQLYCKNKLGDPFFFLHYSRLPITRTFKGNRKRFKLLGARKNSRE